MKLKDQAELLKQFGVEVSVRDWGELDIRNGYIGKGVSVITEKGEVKLSLTGGWFNLAEIREHHQALTTGLQILEALSQE